MKHTKLGMLATNTNTSKLWTMCLIIVFVSLLASCSRKVYPDKVVEPSTTIPTPSPTPDTTLLPKWSYPLPGAKVTSYYGPRGNRQHKGVDLQTFKGDSIRATFNGEVVFSGTSRGFGNLVRIKHDNGLETYYAHNIRNLVKKGDFVRAGQVIALLGQTGRATGPHLHFETHVKGKARNPANYFDLKNQTFRTGSTTANNNKKNTTQRTKKRKRRR